MYKTGYLLTTLCTLASITHCASTGPDYEHLPHDTIFPGPWESYIKAPNNKSHIQPSKIFAREGSVSGAESVLLNGDKKDGAPWTIRPGGLITFEFEENISGK